MKNMIEIFIYLTIQIDLNFFRRKLNRLDDFAVLSLIKTMDTIGLNLRNLVSQFIEYLSTLDQRESCYKLTRACLLHYSPNRKIKIIECLNIRVWDIILIRIWWSTISNDTWLIIFSLSQTIIFIVCMDYSYIIH